VAFDPIAQCQPPIRRRRQRAASAHSGHQNDPSKKFDLAVTRHRYLDDDASDAVDGHASLEKFARRAQGKLVRGAL
jgi:hypothetical protein